MSESDAEPAGQADDGWQTGKNGRQFTRIPGVGGYQGIAWRKAEDETPAQAIDRRRRELAAGGVQKQPPRSKRARQREPDQASGQTERTRPEPVSRDQLTRKIQAMCEDVLCSPTLVFAGFGLQWEADHFAAQGERFAANIARSSETNPWLRKHLERALEGEQTAMAILTSFNLATGAIGYVLPPLIKWGVVPAPASARRIFGVPSPVAQGTRPIVPPAPYQPPVTDAMQTVAALWQQAEQNGHGAPPAPPAATMPGDGNVAPPAAPPTDERVSQSDQA